MHVVTCAKGHISIEFPQKETPSGGPSEIAALDGRIFGSGSQGFFDKLKKSSMKNQPSFILRVRTILTFLYKNGHSLKVLLHGD